MAPDTATHIGYFSLHEAGTRNFTESERHNGNEMHSISRTTLLSLLRRYGIRRVVAENVNMNRHFYDMQQLSELRGALLEVCDELDIPEPKFVNPAILKKWVTGDGYVAKAQIVVACKDRYSTVPADDNAADTCHLFYYYIRRYRL